MVYTINDVKDISYNNEIKKLSNDEKQSIVDEWNAWEGKSGERKLAEIKEIRLQKLIETDYLANSDVTMPDNIKTWRQSLRDIPANHTDENAYDLLLARNDAGELTHSIWSKP
jgi:type I restriction-modification system DNA methylase subunit